MGKTQNKRTVYKVDLNDFLHFAAKMVPHIGHPLVLTEIVNAVTAVKGAEKRAITKEEAGQLIRRIY